MARIVENTAQRLELQSGSTRIAFDKAAGLMTLHRKIMFIALKPTTMPLTDAADVSLDTSTDPASRAEMYRLLLKLRAGGAWALSADDKASGLAAVAAVREFLGQPRS